MAGPLPTVVLARRYDEDPTFRALVDHMASVLRHRDATPRYVWEAILLAEHHVFESLQSVLTDTSPEDAQC
jgi:hypothetical protein